MPAPELQFGTRIDPPQPIPATQLIEQDGSSFDRSSLKGRWSLYRIRPDGSGRRPIGQGTLDELDPSFSPDGRLVVYVGDDGFQKQLYLRRFDGSGDRLLLGSGGGTDPIW